MSNKKRFKIGSRVNGITFENKRCFGEYRGTRNSFGVWVHGILEGEFNPPSLHICQALTLETPPIPKITGRKPGRPPRFVFRDPVKGLTKDNQKASGFYMNAEGSSAWIKGWLEGESKFNPPESIKVLSTSLVKNAK
jgi:hypothetical protein